MTRTNEQREARYLAEWLIRRGPKGETIQRVKLGPLAKGFTSVAAKWADAVILQNDRTIIVEAKFDKPSAGVGQLLIYKELFPRTPGFTDRAQLPIDLILVTPVNDVDVVLAAQRLGVEVDVWTPADLLAEIALGSSLL